MNNAIFRDLHVNRVDSLVPLTDLDNTGVVGTGIDFGDTKTLNHEVVVVMGALTDIARVFVTLQESFEGGSVWNTIGAFPALTAAGNYVQSFKRSKRFIRAVVTTEPPASPTAPAFTAAVLLLT